MIGTSRGSRREALAGSLGLLALLGLTGCWQQPATVAVMTPVRIATEVRPAAATLTTGRTVTFSARVDGEPAAETAWRVLEPGGGSVTDSGQYRAPGQPGVYTVQAAFPEGMGGPATARVTVVAPPAGAIQAPARLLAGAMDQQAGIDPVPGSHYAWTVTGGEITAGTDAPRVTFVAGAGPRVTLVCQVTNAAGDQLRSSLDVPVAAPVTLTISPAKAIITAERTMKFGFSIQGGTSLGVVWRLGEPGAGSLDASGGYVAPAVPGEYTVRVTAQDDPTVSATARVTVVAAPPEGLVAPETFQPGAQNLRAVVPEVPGMTYAWEIEGGSFSGPTDGPAVVFQAGAGPTLTLRCRISNAAGDSAVAKQVLNVQ